MKNKTMSIKHLASIWYIETLHTQHHLRLIIMINIITVLKKIKGHKEKISDQEKLIPALAEGLTLQLWGRELQEGTVGNLIK